MCSLVMSFFSRDYIKREIKYQQCFNMLARVQYLHSAWFLDGRTSILVDYAFKFKWFTVKFKFLFNQWLSAPI